MATTKITITLDNAQLRSIREHVDAGKAGSISGFVQHAVSVALFDAEGWREMLQDALMQTGGPLTGEETAWADSILQDSRESKSSGSRGGKNKAA